MKKLPSFKVVPLMIRIIMAGMMAVPASCATRRNLMTFAYGRCSISQDGLKLAFNKMSGPYLAPGVRDDVYVANRDGTGISLLTSAAGVRSSWPWFSPDGKFLTYTSSRFADQSSTICVMTTDARLSQRLTPVDWNVAAPSYSRDGSKIVFARAARLRPYSMGGSIWDNWDVWEMNADGSSVQQLTFEQYYSIDPPYFSPDGKQILFGAEVNGGKEDASKARHVLLLLNIEKLGSASPTPIPLPPGVPERDFDGQPSFSPDGSSLVFASLREPVQSVRLRNLDSRSRWEEYEADHAQSFCQSIPDLRT